LPLAIELAAIQINKMLPQELLDRLGNRLELLTGGARDLPARQQTLRNTVEWSYELLSEGEKKLSQRLAVFRGGCTLEAVEAMCNAEGNIRVPAAKWQGEVDVLDGVTSLVDKSLLRRG